MVFGKRKQQRAAARAEEDVLLARVALSTLSVTDRPFEEVGLVWGDAAPHEAEALRTLARNALERGADAVLGLSLYATGSERLMSTRRRNDEWRAFGTGVRWR
ncbi:hypothetical protein BLA60_00755 [Actinophytocola xinjiangensis]|uniref:Uncharacterized protein n=1 Tax=Actinophytocola xinjiangensis TaxID=485602 RepID=A0A7Z1B0M2_9PSEU|nr:hypothetical protein [Actinophytocola xinjiangensis]OLF13765.1 hypothetical protein BLA60_00755 [Actinophytocola xinjiangensis]